MSRVNGDTPSVQSLAPLHVRKEDVLGAPFPHVIGQPFLDPELYSRLKAEFPANEYFDRDVSVGGRSGRDIYRGDQEMSELLRGSPAWREFHEFINSPSFLATTLEFFGEFFEEFGCKVSTESACFGDYAEPREALVTKSRVGRAISKVRNALTSVDPNDIYSRLDIHQAAESYGKPVHCDRHNRLVSMIVYLCDADEIGCVGGDLSVHEHKVRKPYSKYERYPARENTSVVTTLRPKDNLGIFFLCANNSYHSVSPITAQNDYRRFVYINLSSRAPQIW